MYLKVQRLHKANSFEIFFTKITLAENEIQQVFYFLIMLATILKMTRPVNIVIAVVTLFIGYFLQGAITFGASDIPLYTLILQAFGFAFAIGFGNIQNDVLDFESDKLNRPERPLPSGRISIGAAKAAWIVMAVLTVACGVADGILSGAYATPSLFFVALVLLLIAYNKVLKHIPLLKNMTVAFLCATPLILNLLYTVIVIDKTTIAFSSRLGSLYPAMLFAFLLTTTREIYKDLEDEIGDLKAGIMTFPLIAGSATARRLAGALAIFSWLLLPLPVVQGYFSKWFLIVAAATLTPTLGAAIVSAHQRKYHRAQGLIKIAMFLGLIALVVSTVVDPHFIVISKATYTQVKPTLVY